MKKSDEGSYSSSPDLSKLRPTFLSLLHSSHATMERKRKGLIYVMKKPRSFTAGEYDLVVLL